MNRFPTSTARVLALAAALAAVTIVFGAYVRLTDAGLGCPDWPGCYGRLVVPASEADLAPGDPNLAARPLETGKAWREMIHRYLASTLGLILLAAVGLHLAAWRRGARLRPSFVALAPLVMLQGVLGMWTVTLLLKPLVVMAHLLGGMTVLALIVWNLLHEMRSTPAAFAPGPRTGLVRVALVVLVGQIALGGWTSTNYAALACADFPTCHGSFWPTMDFAKGFKPWHGLGIDYEYGILDAPARIAIHYTHRLGALVTALVVGFVGFALWRRGVAAERLAGLATVGALGAQLLLGILNVVLMLPVPVAVAHNGVAATLLVSVVTCLYYSRLVRAPASATRPGRFAASIADRSHALTPNS